MTLTQKATLLPIVVLALVVVALYGASEAYNSLSRRLTDPERSYMVHTAALRDANAAFDAFHYTFSYEDINRTDCTWLGLECWAELVNRKGEQLRRWDAKTPVLAGTGGTITVRAVLKDGKIQCEVTAAPNIPGIQSKLTVSPENWTGDLSDASFGRVILSPDYLDAGPQPGKAVELIRYRKDPDLSLRIMARFVYREMHNGAIPPAGN